MTITARVASTPVTAPATGAHRPAATYDSSAFAPISRSFRERFTASRSSIWTTRPRPRSRERCSRRSRATTATINANVHRGVHELSARATDAFEAARERVRRVLQRRDTHEIIFTRNATESINLVAQSFARPALARGRRDCSISAMEHHSNIVPWQLVCELSGRAAARCADRRSRRADSRAVRAAAGSAHAAGVDRRTCRTRSARSTRSTRSCRWRTRTASPCCSTDRRRRITCRVDVQALDCDFYAATGHKLYGPTGIGVLYGKRALLEAMPPFMGGGDMISSVTFERQHLERAAVQVRGGNAGHRRRRRPARGAGLHRRDRSGPRSRRTSAACWRTARRCSKPCRASASSGRAPEKASILSFVMEGVHPHDIGTIVDGEGIAIRTGHHCAQPVMERFSVPATARASLAMYNTREELDALGRALRRVHDVFA